MKNHWSQCDTPDHCVRVAPMRGCETGAGACRVLVNHLVAKLPRSRSADHVRVVHELRQRPNGRRANFEP